MTQNLQFKESAWFRNPGNDQNASHPLSRLQDYGEKSCWDLFYRLTFQEMPIYPV